ncbi:MAG: alpha/beta hydrolase [Candidatus Helarchaeota archaeon]
MSYESENYWYNYCLELEPQVIETAISEESIVSNEKKIHLDIYGKDENLKTTILFIHGTAVYSRFYVEFLYHLNRQGYRIVALDLPGHGLSEGKRGHFTMESLISTIYNVTSFIIERFGEHVVIMGSSLGGFTALYSVANDPRIKAGICHNAAILNEGAYKKIIKVGFFLGILKPFVPYLAKIFPTLRISVWRYLHLEDLFHDKQLLEKLDVFKEDPLLSDRYTLRALATQMRAPLPNPIETIKTPVMIINGDQDVLFSVEYMQEIFGRLEKSQNKRLEIIPNASHLIFQEHRDESIKRITTWLDEIL